MTIQQKCPICNGYGIVPEVFYYSYLGCIYMTTNTSEPCRNCNGSGVVYVEQEEENYEIRF